MTSFLKPWILLVALGVATAGCSVRDVSLDRTCSQAAAGDDTCIDCLATACCADYSVTMSSDEASAYINCYSDCSGDSSCEDDCAASHKAGRALYLKLGECMVASCETDCEDSGGTGTIEPACTELVDDTQVCGVCMGAYCCDELVVCTDDANCLEYLGCASACTEDACYETCATDYADGYDVYLGLHQCTLASCSSECELSTDDPSSGDPGTGTTDDQCASLLESTEACYVCLGTNCCEEAVAYNADSSASDYSTCLTDCNEDTDCISGCGSDFEEGAVLYDELSSCLIDSCSTECASLSG